MNIVYKTTNVTVQEATLIQKHDTKRYRVFVLESETHI